MTIRAKVNHTHGRQEHFKDFDNLQEMLDYAFQLCVEAKTNEIVLSKDKRDSDEPYYDYEVEIYDDYRE